MWFKLFVQNLTIGTIYVNIKNKTIYLFIYFFERTLFFLYHTSMKYTFVYVLISFISDKSVNFIMFLYIIFLIMQLSIFPPFRRLCLTFFHYFPLFLIYYQILVSFCHSVLYQQSLNVILYIYRLILC